MLINITHKQTLSMPRLRVREQHYKRIEKGGMGGIHGRPTSY